MQDHAFDIIAHIINDQVLRYTLTEHILPSFRVNPQLGLTAVLGYDPTAATTALVDLCQRQRKLIHKKLSWHATANANWRALAAYLVDEDDVKSDNYQRGKALAHELFLMDDVEREAEELTWDCGAALITALCCHNWLCLLCLLISCLVPHCAPLEAYWPQCYVTAASDGCERSGCEHRGLASRSPTIVSGGTVACS